MSYFNKFFGLYWDGNKMFFYWLGKKYKKEKSRQKQIIEKLDTLINFENDLNRIIQENISTALMHQKTFGSYKNLHNGDTLVLVATGPSAKHYRPLENVFHIGVNKSYQMKNIDFKYYFVHDYEAVKDYMDEIVNYKPETCEKFFGLSCEYNRETHKRMVPESYTIKANAKRFRTDWTKVKNFKPRYMYDIASCPLCTYESVVMPAIQFALWTNPKKFYIVGCDCSLDGYFDNTMPVFKLPADRIIEGWKKFKEFRDIYYPETEIISVNPVNLKGLFKDVYTKSFLIEKGIEDFSGYEVID